MKKTVQTNVNSGKTLKNGVDIVFENIQYSVQVQKNRSSFTLPWKKEYETKQILKGITGIAKASQVTAIMGASGAGKTTLLNIISCRIPFQPQKQKLLQEKSPIIQKKTLGIATGKLLANDTAYNFKSFGDFSNYVMQEDVLLQSLTVRETLQYVAALKLNIPYEERKQRVMTLVNSLKLEKCIDTLVGGSLLKGISGGERKRTSIAFELVSNPSVIILDEPTSGLDSLTAYIICSYLRKLARTENKTVVMTIHQPNSQIFGLFDKLILLVGGRSVYQGLAKSSVGYFDKMGFTCPEFSNPPDYFMSILHHESSVNVKNYPKYFETHDKQLTGQISNQIDNRSRMPIMARDEKVPFCQSLGSIIKRDFLNTARNPMIVRARIVMCIILGLFTGGVYWKIGQNYVSPNDPNVRTPDFMTVSGLLFYMSMSMFMSSLSPVSIVFPKERLVFLKEEGARLYSTWMFYLSRTIVELPFLILIPMLFAVIIYWMIGLADTAGQFFMFYLISFFVSFAGNSMGLLLGCAIPDAKLISVLTPVFILPFVLFSGFYKNRADLPNWLFWIEYLSPIKYSFISYVKNQFSQYGSNSPVHLLQFEDALTMWSSLAVLIGLCIFIRIMSYILLYRGRTRLQ